MKGTWPQAVFYELPANVACACGHLVMFDSHPLTDSLKRGFFTFRCHNSKYENIGITFKWQVKEKLCEAQQQTVPS